MRFLTNKRKRVAAIVVAVLSAALLLGAQYLAHWQSEQVAAYNYGIQLYQAGDHMCSPDELDNPIGNKCVDVDGAIKAFGASIAAYNQAKNNPSWVQRYLLPPPSREDAALAALHMGVLFLAKQKPDDAVRAFKLGLTINPNIDAFSAGTCPPGKGQTGPQDCVTLTDPELAGLSPAELARLHSIALTTQYDLELLFKNNPSQAQAQGKGKGKGQQQGKEPTTPEQDPSNAAGKGNRDAI